MQVQAETPSQATAATSLTAPVAAAAPLEEYERRLDARRTAATDAERLDDRLSLARGVVFLAGLVLLIAVWNIAGLSPWWLAVPVGVFVALVIAHGRAIERRARSEAAVGYYETAIDRLDGRWAGVGATGERYADPQHPFAADLDLFGRASLFQLLSRALHRARSTSGGWTRVAPPRLKRSGSMTGCRWPAAWCFWRSWCC